MAPSSETGSGDIDSVPVSVVHVTIPNNSSIAQSMIQQNPTIIQTAPGGQTIQAIQVEFQGTEVQLTLKVLNF